MTLVMLAAVLVDRRGFTMRNLAYAALAVILFEPEALLGASFQLSFAAVAALVAVYEGRMRAVPRGSVDEMPARAPPPQGRVARMAHRLIHAPRHALVATACATAATASFMAANFHELSPYVLIGNPLTLGIIEFFAVPGALLGTLLAPLGLDGPVWTYVGLGIRFVLWAAHGIAAAPGATIHLPAFQPFAVVFLALGVLSVVIWRTPLLRASAVPLFAIGIVGAANGPDADLVVPPTGEVAAVRTASGLLRLVGQRPNAFTAEQWLRADGDGRSPGDAALPKVGRFRPGCDAMGCVAELIDGRILSIVTEADAFEEDCRRAQVIVSALVAPVGCAAPLVLDRRRLDATGAVAVSLRGGGLDVRTQRSVTRDRPWSPRPVWRSDTVDIAASDPAASDAVTGSNETMPLATLDAPDDFAP